MLWYSYALFVWLFLRLGHRLHETISKKSHPPSGAFSKEPQGARAGEMAENEGPGKADAIFQLYTRRNPVNGELIRVGRINALKASKFDPRVPTKIIIHGYLASAKKQYILNIKDGYMNVSNVNVVMVDWRNLAARSYLHSVWNAAAVGRRVAQLVSFLAVRYGATLASFHIIGHSLGAHVAGAAGAKLRKSGGLVGRITGLDPASPLFNEIGPAFRLDPTDAAFVDVIHTCGAKLGYRQPCGHVDFYPNGGADPQPGCEAVRNADLEQESCSHRRAVEFFSESLTSPRGFPALPCKSWHTYARGKCKATDDRIVYMGDSVGTHRMDLRARGIFYLKTASSFPFSQLATERRAKWGNWGNWGNKRN